MANEESMTRHWAKAVWIRVRVFQLGWFDVCIFLGAAAMVLKENVTEIQIFDGMAWNPRDDRRLLRSGIRNHNVADLYAPYLTDRNAFRTPHPASQTYEERHINRLAHCNVADGNIF